MGPATLDSRPPYLFLTHSPSPQSKIRNTLKLKKKKNYLFYFQSKKKKKKKPKKKIELKSKKKKNIYIYIYNKAKPTASPLQVAYSRQAHRFSTKKKKKIQKIRNWTHHIAGRIPSRRIVAGREIKPQYKSKLNTKNSSKPNTAPTNQT